MLISFKKKFIFFHNYKVAGTSLRRYFTEYQNSLFPLLSSAVHRLKIQRFAGIDFFNNHLKPERAKKYLPNSIFENYFKFGFVRNPWSWQVSLYTYMLKTPYHAQHAKISTMENFAEYIHWRITKDLKFQTDFFYDENGVKQVDYIGKIEKLNNEIQKVCRILDIPYKKIPRLNVSAKKKWTDYYDINTFNLVKETFGKDIENFNYVDVPEFYGIKEK